MAGRRDAEIKFVTGAPQAIGLATARRLAQDEFHVVAMDRSAEKLAAAVSELVGEGLRVDACVLDICDRASVVSAMTAVPRVDVLVCAAGIYNDATFLDISDDAFRRMLEVNVLGTFIPVQEAARRMTRGGRIVTISSSGALGGTRFAHYVASKAAVVGLTMAMAMELRPAGIALNSVAPGFTDTPMIRSGPPEMFAAWEALEPSGRAADPPRSRMRSPFSRHPRRAS